MGQNVTELKQLYRQAVCTSPRESDSSEHLLALTRIHLAVYRLLTLEGYPEEELTDRRSLNAYGDLLFDTIARKAEQAESAAERMELVPALHDLIYEASPVTDPQKQSVWKRLVISIFRAYYPTIRTTDKSLLPAFCRCIADYYCYSAPTTDELFLLLEDTVSEWASTQNADGSWPDISSGEAFQRQEVMKRYAGMCVEEDMQNLVNGWSRQ